MSRCLFLFGRGFQDVFILVRGFHAVFVLVGLFVLGRGFHAVFVLGRGSRCSIGCRPTKKGLMLLGPCF